VARPDRRRGSIRTDADVRVLDGHALNRDGTTRDEPSFGRKNVRPDDRATTSSSPTKPTPCTRSSGPVSNRPLLGVVQASDARLEVLRDHASPRRPTVGAPSARTEQPAHLDAAGATPRAVRRFASRDAAGHDDDGRRDNRFDNGHLHVGRGARRADRRVAGGGRGTVIRYGPGLAPPPAPVALPIGVVEDPFRGARVRASGTSAAAPPGGRPARLAVPVPTEAGHAQHDDDATPATHEPATGNDAPSRTRVDKRPATRDFRSGTVRLATSRRTPGCAAATAHPTSPPRLPRGYPGLHQEGKERPADRPGDRRVPARVRHRNPAPSGPR
jgi:hypothetical protein